MRFVLFHPSHKPFTYLILQPHTRNGVANFQISPQILLECIIIGIITLTKFECWNSCVIHVNKMRA